MIRALRTFPVHRLWAQHSISGLRHRSATAMTTEAGDPIPPQDRLFQCTVKQIGSERIATEFMTLPISGDPLPLTIFVVCRHHEYWSEVPGNPGIIDYYKAFMLRLHQHTKGRVEICGLSHAGHVAGLTPHGPLYSVDDQVQHKTDYLRDRLAQDPSRKLILVGHSVGAYICLQLLKALPADNVLAVWALYPTVMHIAKSPNGVRMRPYFSHHKAAASILGTLAYLPGFMKRAVLRIALTAEQGAAMEPSLKLVDFHSVNNAFYMAKTEMERIHDIDAEAVAPNLGKIVWYFAPGDGWAPEHQYEDLRAQYPQARAYLCTDNTRHAFCTYDHESELIADKAFDWLVEAYAPARPE